MGGYMIQSGEAASAVDVFLFRRGGYVIMDLLSEDAESDWNTTVSWLHGHGWGISDDPTAVLGRTEVYRVFRS